MTANLVLSGSRQEIERFIGEGMAAVNMKAAAKLPESDLPALIQIAVTRAIDIGLCEITLPNDAAELPAT